MNSTIILKGITTIVFAFWFSVFLTHSDLVSLNRSEPFRYYISTIRKLSNEEGKSIPKDSHSGLLCINSVTYRKY